MLKRGWVTEETLGTKSTIVSQHQERRPEREIKKSEIRGERETEIQYNGKLTIATKIIIEIKHTNLYKRRQCSIGPGPTRASLCPCCAISPVCPTTACPRLEGSCPCRSPGWLCRGVNMEDISASPHRFPCLLLYGPKPLSQVLSPKHMDLIQISQRKGRRELLLSLEFATYHCCRSCFLFLLLFSTKHGWSPPRPLWEPQTAWAGSSVLPV